MNIIKRSIGLLTHIKLKEIFTKDYLLQCINDGLTLKEVAEINNELHGKNMNPSNVFYHAKRHGLQWGRLRREPVELDIEGLIETTQMVKKTLNYVKEVNREPIDYDKVIRDPIMVLISDVHVGSLRDRKGIVDWREQTKSRFRFLKDGLKERLKQSNHYPEKITICLLGDLVDGFNIYPSQIENSHTIINDQIDVITGELLDFILYAYQHTSEIEVVGVQGNHGRISKQSEINNWDSLVYLTLKKSIEFLIKSLDLDGIDAFNITVKYAPKFLMYHEEGRWTYLLGHGHKVLTRAALNNVHKMNEKLMAKSMYSRDFDVFCMGHVHQTRYWTVGPNKYFISNGTAYDSEHFAEELGFPSDLRFTVFSYNEHTPIQNVWFISLVPDDYYE